MVSINTPMQPLSNHYGIYSTHAYEIQITNYGIYCGAMYDNELLRLYIEDTGQYIEDKILLSTTFTSQGQLGEDYDKSHEEQRPERHK